MTKSIGMDELVAHGFVMMCCSEVLGKVKISSIFNTWSQLGKQLAIGRSLLYPVETHVNSFAPALLDGFANRALVVSLS